MFYICSIDAKLKVIIKTNSNFRANMMKRTESFEQRYNRDIIRIKKFQCCTIIEKLAPI